MEWVVIVPMLLLACCFYFMARNNKVYNIRSVWIDTGDVRWDIYSYNYMFLPNKKNWFGVRWPQDSQYEKIK